MVTQLNIAQGIVDNISFERVHRMGATGSDSTFERNIVAKFTLFKDRDMVRRQAKGLKGTRFFVYEQFPGEIAKRRKSLVPRMKAAHRDNKRAWISNDTLYIDGHAVRD